MTMRIERSYRLACLLSSMLIPVIFSTPAAAQDAAADSAVAEDEITVTGSRLIRRDLVASSPITTLDAEQIQASGNVTLEDTLNEFPQIKPGNTGSSNQSGGAGILTADLRGLGPVRTLVLVDGRRYIPADVTGLTDLSTIPDMLVERVEIVTGGASAVYGSDAIAGAVNFVLQRKFEGVKVQAQYGETTRGDGGNYKIDLMLGANSSDGRGNATLFGSYTDRNAVRFANRAFARQPFLPDAQGVLQPFGTGTIPGALIGVTAPDLPRIQGVNLTNPGGTCPGPIQGVRFGAGSVPAPFCRPVDQYNYAAPNFLLRPLERWQLGGTAAYEITDNVEAYANAFFTRKVNAYQQAPEALNPNSAGQEAGTLIIPNADTNPLFSAGIAQLLRRQPRVLRRRRRRHLHRTQRFLADRRVRQPHRRDDRRKLYRHGRPARRRRAVGQRLELGQFLPIFAIGFQVQPVQPPLAVAADARPRCRAGERRCAMPGPAARLRSGDDFRHRRADPGDG